MEHVICCANIGYVLSIVPLSKYGFAFFSQNMESAGGIPESRDYM